MAIKSNRICILDFQRLQILPPVAPYSNRKVWFRVVLSLELNSMCFLVYLTQLSVTFALDSFVTFQARNEDCGIAIARFVLQVNGCNLMRDWDSDCDEYIA